MAGAVLTPQAATQAGPENLITHLPHTMTITLHSTPSPSSLLILTVEDEDGGSMPVGMTSSLAEAEEMAEEHYRRLAADPASAAICPVDYVIWSRCESGDFAALATLTV